MSVKLTASCASTQKWHPIPLGGDQDFEVLIKRPDFPQQVQILATEAGVARTRARLEASVIDWKGVEDENDVPVPFSMPTLEALISTYPQALRTLDILVSNAWFTLPEDLEKNWQTPPENGGTETTDETTPLIPSSDYGHCSESEPVSVNGSEI